MPIYKSIFTFDDDLENRIKSICYDPLSKGTIRKIQQESNQRKGMIYPGAKFSGFQTSNSVGVTNSLNPNNNGSGNENDQRYDVTVELQDVDLINSLVAGYLTISNLTTVIKISKYLF